MNMKLKTSFRGISLLFIVVPVIVMLIVGILVTSSSAKAMLSEEIGVISYLKSAGLTGKLDMFRTDLIAASNMDAIKQTSRGLYTDTETSMDAYIKNTITRNPLILDIVVTDTNGVIAIDHIGRGVGSLFSGYVGELSTLGKNDVLISDFLLEHSDYNKQSVFYMTKAVRYNENLSGYITYVISTDVFDNLLGQDHILDHGTMLIVDSKGSALGFADSDVVRQSEIPYSGVKAQIGEVAGVVKNNTSNYTSFDAHDYIGTYGNVENSQWKWFCIYPNSEITSLYMSTYIISLVVTLILAGASIATMVVVSHRAFAPMNDMIAKMELLNAGELDTRFDIKGNNEFSHMSETFNDLIDEVVISEELHRTISEISNNILFEWDFHKEVMYVSDNFLELFDVNIDQSTLLNGKFIDSIMEKEDADKYKQAMNKLFKSKDSTANEYRLVTKQGPSIWVSVRAQCVCDRFGELLRIIGVITNIDAEKKLTLQLSERASYDFLSQLYNRNTFLREFRTELERSATRKIGIVFIDVDDFKLINDRYGHSVGDEIIKYVSSVIKEQTGDTGFAGRFGGDEFIICITNQAAVAGIEKMVTKLIDIFNEGYYSESSDVNIKIKISIGIAKAPEHGRDPETLIAEADEAMYFVKKNGKSNFHVYNPNDSNLVDVMHTM